MPCALLCSAAPLPRRDRKYPAYDGERKLEMRAHGPHSNVPVAVPDRASHGEVDGLDLDRQLEAIQQGHLHYVHLRNSKSACNPSLSGDRMYARKRTVEI